MHLKSFLPGAILLLFLGPLMGAEELTMQLASSAFQEGQSIPTLYTCQGKGISPPLRWSGAPSATKSFALISEDPDAPGGTWVHWVLWNLPPSSMALEQSVPTDRRLKNGTYQGYNDFRRVGYGGPCPPSGTHRYFFTLYALDTTLDLKRNSSKTELLAAMKGHILAQATLMGTYQRL